MAFMVDDQIAHHPKFIAAGNAAVGVWVRAGAWTKAHVQGGFVPSEIAHGFGRAESRRLVAVGLWVVAEGGYRFHDWEDMPGNEDAETEKARREDRREKNRLRKQAQRARESQRESQRDAVGSHAVSPHPPIPIPIPNDVTYDGHGPHVPDADARNDDDPILAAMSQRRIRDLPRVRRAFAAVLDPDATDGEVLDLAGIILDRSRTAVAHPEAYLEKAARDSPSELAGYAVEVQAKSPRRVLA